MAEVTMPQLGETVTEGTITKWFKQVGDTVAVDEVLFEVSTDKVDSEVPSPVAGVLTEIRANEGDTVPVGAVIAVVSDATVVPAAGSPSEKAAPPVPVPPSPPPPPEAAVSAASPEVSAAPSESSSADKVPLSAAAQPGAASEPTAARRTSTDTPTSKLLSPVVRQLAREHGLDLSRVQGTGAGGRVTRADVERAIQARGLVSGSSPTGSAAASSPPSFTPPSAVEPGESPARTQRAVPPPLIRAPGADTIVPLNNIRKRTGEHMVRSKEVSPHAYSVAEVDYENVERVRRRHRDQWRAEEGFSLTYLPFIARAVIDALRNFPHLNASVGNGELIVHNAVHLGIAVDLDFEGLIAPVIHSADDKRLRAIAREIHDLAERARSKKLSVDDITGGTFTITNNGSFGTHMVLPIISQPQVAILSTDAIVRKPVVITDAAGNEGIAIHSVGMLALAWDHRAFDGSYAGAFLAEVKAILETRDWETEL
ncbi:MAG: 2-oxo acid dehydrogenase subunit E2 [Acidimicrobiales bacterium]|nr:2-oxo acid dehydrogenase subunit E2 [Acidimicrobiales bacterium]